MGKFQKEEVEKDIFKNLKKYIAGFRSGNPKNKKKAKMYYILAIAFFVIGSSWQISDFAVLLLMLIAPSVFYNFKSMRSGQKGYRRIFALTLALFVGTTVVFNATYVKEDLNQETIEAKTPSGSTIMKGKDYESVVETFEEKGFTNIKLEKIEDLITGWLAKDGEVEDVSVGGDVEYSPDKLVKADTEVIIRYHTFPEEDTEIAKDNTNQEDIKEEAPLKEESAKEEVKEPEIYTIDNCPDMVKFVKAYDSEFLKEFAEKYSGKTIQFNGAVDIFEKHPKYNTRYEALLRTCDYDPNKVQGPTIKTWDFYINDDRSFSNLEEGNNVIITAKVKDYNEDNGLFRVYLEKVESR
ncbi:MAG: DUF4839 domain-containing protein [Peptostreptococcaceae bacterium]